MPVCLCVYNVHISRAPHLSSYPDKSSRNKESIPNKYGHRMSECGNDDEKKETMGTKRDKEYE